MSNFVRLDVCSNDFSKIACKHILEGLSWLWANSVLNKNYEDREYRQEWAYEGESTEDKRGFKLRAETWVQRISLVDGELGASLLEIPSLMDKVYEEGVSLSFDVYMVVMADLLIKVNPLFSRVSHEPNSSEVLCEDGKVVYLVPSEHKTAGYVGAVAYLINNISTSGRIPTVQEQCCIFAAETLLDNGSPLGLLSFPWGKPGFRQHQTLMSVTDPGPGHIRGTCLDSNNLSGVIVHIEHLERGVDIPREDVEPYRIPSPKMVPRVCLWGALQAPVSTYVGRPMFDGDFRNSLLKTVRSLAATCNSFFASGVTECKIAIEGMTVLESIEFLQAMRENVIRNSQKQILSAAFCINVPIVDDRFGRSKEVVDRFDVGMIGIDIACAARIEKVTWDGTADTYPSQCVMEQLGYEKALRLVHKAHENGLLTYFSAGFRLHHISDAVCTGVDGIGIGGAQILRYMDYENGNHGPFKHSNIKGILAQRDAASSTYLGRAAKILARLDVMKHEGKISSVEDGYREQLFGAMVSRNELEISVLLGELSYLSELFNDSSLVDDALYEMT